MNQQEQTWVRALIKQEVQSAEQRILDAIKNEKITMQINVVEDDKPQRAEGK